MTPRPLYRWKSFWLGILVSGFLGWAWWLSHDYEFYASYGRIAGGQRGGHVMVVGRGRSATRNEVAHMRVPRGENLFQFAPPPFIARGEGKMPSQSPPESLPEKVKFQAAMEARYSTLPKDYRGIFLPHWLLVTLFLVPWVSFLGWRWRRQRILTKINS